MSGNWWNELLEEEGWFAEAEEWELPEEFKPYFEDYVVAEIGEELEISSLPSAETVINRIRSYRENRAASGGGTSCGNGGCSSCRCGKQ